MIGNIPVRWKCSASTRRGSENSLLICGALELGDFKAHHVARRLAHKLLLALGLSMLGDDFAGHCRVFLIGDRMHGEKLNLFVI